MSEYSLPTLWHTKTRRKRPLILWLIVFSAVALSTLLYSTSRLASTVDNRIRRRSAVVQHPLQDSINNDHDEQTSLAEDDYAATSRTDVSQTEIDSAEISVKIPDSDVNPNWLVTPDTSAFPSYAKYSALVEKADGLPDVVYISFEEATEDDVLTGWEAEWVSHGTYNTTTWGLLKEPRIDFVYTWVNGSDTSFRATKRPYELNSTLHDKEGTWIGRHGENRYRDWNEFKYSVRSVEKYAPFRNKIQVLVNSLSENDQQVSKQIPGWLDQRRAGDIFEVLTQEDFFESDKRHCLPSFNSLTIENQLHNTESGVDRVRHFCKLYLYLKY